MASANEQKLTSDFVEAKITLNMVNKLDCVKQNTITLPTPLADDDVQATGDAGKTAKVTKYAWNSPRLMIIFHDADLNCAAHHLLSSLHNPFAKDAVATLLIQESVVGLFTKKIVLKMNALDAKLANHPSFKNSLVKIKELNAKTIVADKSRVQANASPTLVLDFTHTYLGGQPGGVITMHTFRTPKECMTVNEKETLRYSSVSIWNEKLSTSYEILNGFDCDTFLLNCFNTSLDPIKAAFTEKRNDATIVKGYHYETLIIGYKQRMIVFPVGNIFAN